MVRLLKVQGSGEVKARDTRTFTWEPVAELTPAISISDELTTEEGHRCASVCSQRR
jgi:hypothetical protein